MSLVLRVSSIAALGSFSLLLACELAPEGSVAADELCATLVETVCETDSRCCDAHPRDCVEVQRSECRAAIQPLVDDPRLAYDPRRGAALVRAIEASAATCWAEPVDPDALLASFSGTGIEGADCTPPDTGARSLRVSALSCASGLACRLHLGADGRARGVCERRMDDACSHALDCGAGQFCALPAGWQPGVWGTCRPLRAQGWACTSDLECASRHCDGTCVAAPGSARCLRTPHAALVEESAPRAHFRFDERTGTRAEDVSGVLTATLSSASMRASESAIGMEMVPMADAGAPRDAGAASGTGGGSIRFGDDMQSVRVAAPFGLEPTGGTSLECWVHSDPSEIARPVLELVDGTRTGVHVWAFPRGDQLYANLVGADGADHPITSSEGALSAGIWHHVVVTHDGTTGRLYLDGRVLGEVAAAGALRLSGDLFVGHRPTGEMPISFRGAIDELALYDRALSPSEIARHHAAAADGAMHTRFSLFRWMR